MLYGNFLKLGKKAQALVLSYIIISVFIVISSALLSKAVNEKNLIQRNKLTSEAFYLAEGANENAIAAFISGIANYQISPAVASFNTSSTFTTFRGTVVNSSIIRVENNERLILEGDTNILVRNYEVVSTARHPENAAISVTLHQIFARRLIPTFQHAVFYNDDLEMLPGPDMTLSGRIHCNKDIYLDSHNTFTIDSFYLHSAGDIYNRRKDDPSDVMNGDVAIRVSKSGAARYESMNGLDSDSSNWTAEAINRWDGTVQSSVHGVTKLVTPSVGSIQTNGYYASNAAVVIVDEAITRNGVPLIEGVDYPAGTITTDTSFYNNREGQDIKMTNVDLAKLANIEGEVSAATGQPFPNNLPSNGLLYATMAEAGSYQPGIRLVNGNEIYQNQGLTVVSNDPVYIQGDYNSVNEKPASVICDSVNLLSNNWNDANSTLGVNSRPATNTTVNCAFIAGINTTAIGNYNGGLENYPRLHENWSAKALNIKGSFVALWNSVIATGAWLYGNPQYTAPSRNWNYNSAFNDPANLPPFTPWAVEARRVAWWKE